MCEREFEATDWHVAWLAPDWPSCAIETAEVTDYESGDIFTVNREYLLTVFGPDAVWEEENRLAQEAMEMSA